MVVFYGIIKLNYSKGMYLMRLQKYLADCSIASRRKAEQYITEGRVKVNARVVDVLGFTVSEGDNVEFDGRIVKPEDKKVYIALYKPKGVVSTASDQFGRQSVTDIVESDVRLYPVGRLDYDTKGLIFLTNDGDFTYHLTHPKHNVIKTYHAVVKGGFSEEKADKLRCGVVLDGVKTAPAEVIINSVYEKTCEVTVRIHEGRNRQVRRMFETVGCTVTNLIRTSIGPVDVGNLKAGQYRELTDGEVRKLMR